MKTITITLFLFFSCFAFSQVGVGNTDPKSTLDISASSTTSPTNEDGILIPRIDNFPTTDPTADQDGMMVFYTGSSLSGKGFYYWDNGSGTWVAVGNNTNDSDWLELGTYTVPDDINDNIYHLGQIRIGSSSINPAKASIVSTVSENRQGLANYHSGSDASAIGYALYNQSNISDIINYTNFYNVNSGTHNSLHWGIRNYFNNNGTGTKYGLENEFDYTAPNGQKIGVSNRFEGGNSETIGVQNSFPGAWTITGNIRGIYNLISAPGNGQHYGLYSSLFGSGSGNKYGTYSSLSGSGTGDQYGNYVNISNSESGTHYGSYNYLTGTGAGYKYGVYSQIHNSAGGIHYGVWSAVDSPTGYAGYFIGRTSLGDSVSNRYLMPAADGTAGQVMTTDGAGNVTFQNVTGDGDTQNTLDQAYDEGGVGAGKNITADNGAVRINGNDGFLVTGTFGSGDTIDSEITGEGTRMFFNPSKAAFRAGYVNGNQWDDASIGNYSTAFGNGNTASGNTSSAFGVGNIADGDYSTVFGYYSIASGIMSTALGIGSTAPSAYETAIGINNTIYTPVSTTSFISNDRLFVIGNGPSTGSRSNALTIFKSGLMNINDEYNMPLTDGTANQVMTTDGAGNVTFQDIVNDSDWVEVGANIERQAGNVYIGDNNATDNNLYISNHLIDWDDTTYFINPNESSIVNSIKFDDGSELNPSIYFSDLDSGFFSPSTGTTGYSSNGNEAFRIQSDGELSINTTTPSQFNFTVRGNVSNNEVRMGNWGSTSSVIEVDHDHSTGNGIYVETSSGHNTNNRSTIATYNSLTNIYTDISRYESGFNSYGVKTSISTNYSGVEYGIYSDVQTTDGYAAYLLGRTSLGNSTSNRYIMPLADGTTGQVIMTDGSGNLTFQNITGDGNTQNTLDQAYDEGGAGAGKNIIADSGALRINGDDGFLVTGTLGSGNTIDSEVTGIGTRMFFNPNKAAFRAGYVSTDQWDNANIGAYSVAFGSGTTASGEVSSAFGAFTIASGQFSMASGAGTTASGQTAIASGTSTTASGDYSTAFGYSTLASGNYSTVFGNDNTASGQYSSVFGNSNTAPSAYETVIGINSTNYTPNSTTSFNNNDRLFVVGNGSMPTMRSNALTIYKDGRMTINDAYTMPTIDGTAGQVMTTDGAGNVTFSTPISTLTAGNDIDITSNQIDLESTLDTVHTINSPNDDFEIHLSSNTSSTNKIIFTTLGPRIPFFSVSPYLTSNIGIGFNNGSENTNAGLYNIFIGRFSGSNTTSSDGTQAEGSHNIALGSQSLQTNTVGGNNIAIGSYSLFNVGSGNRNVAIGSSALNSTLGTGNIAIGYNAGTNETGSNKLYIENSNANANNALIYGEFDNDILRTNGELQIGNPSSGGYAFPIADGANGQVLTSDGVGNITFQNPTINTDDQQIDNFSFNSTTNILTLEIEDDGQAAQTVDLSSLNPTKSIARMYMSLSQTETGGGTTKVNFDTVDFDINSNFNTTTDEFTVPADGIYRVTAQITLDASTGTGVFGVRIRVDGTQERRSEYNHHGNGELVRQVTSILNLTAGQTIDVAFLRPGVGATIQANSRGSFFEIEQL